MIPTDILLWVIFNIFILGMLALDLGVFHREAHVVGIKESLIWSTIWVVLALLFNVGVYIFGGSDKALEFLTGYIIERSLSIDNIFVFILVFSYFSVPRIYQHRVLFWGILGALITRAIFIVAGVVIIERFFWVIYIFGAFLVFTGIRMALQEEKEIHPEKNPALRLVRRLISVTNGYEGGKFFVRRAGRILATPLFIVLLVVETTDVVFAVDSIPAILAITLDPFIVYSSNVFAILGLRALYFALAGLMQLFHYLHYGLAGILVFVGVKMLLTDVYHMPIAIALGAIAGILTVSVIVSVLFPKVEVAPPPGLPAEETEPLHKSDR